MKKLAKAVENSEYNFLMECLRNRNIYSKLSLSADERRELLKVALAKNDKIPVSMILDAAPFGISPQNSDAEFAHARSQRSGSDEILSMLYDNYLLFIISRDCNKELFRKMGQGSCESISFEEYSDRAAEYGLPSGKHLYRAIEYGKTDIIDYLLKKKIDVNFSEYLDYHYRKKWPKTSADFNVRAESIIHLAVKKGDTRLAKRLLEMGANANSTNDSRETPAHYAARRGSSETLALLAKHGADLSKEASYQFVGGYTPLDYAVREGHRDVVEYLVKNTPRRSAKVAHPVIIASEKGFVQIAGLLLRTRHVPYDAEVLQEALLRTIRGNQKSYQEVISLLLKHGLSIKEVSNEAFEHSIRKGKNDLLSIIKAQGGDVLFVDASGTYIHEAAINGNVTAIEYFISRGVDSKIKNKNGKTAYDLALLNGHKNAADYLSGRKLAAFAPGEIGYTTETATNLGKTASTRSRVLMQLPFGTPFDVRASKDDWLHICLKNNPKLCGCLHKSVACKDPVDAKKKVLIDELKKAFQARRSIAGSEVDGNEFNLGLLGPDETYLRGMQEKLEQFMYFEPERTLLKQRMRALFILNMRLDRHSKYKNTPVGVLQASRQYGSLPVAAYNYAHKDSLRHLVKLPKPKASFFRNTEQVLYVKGSGSGATIQEFRHVSHALFAQLLRLYFPKSNDFRLQKDEASSHYYYKSKKAIEFLSIHDGRLKKHRAKIQYTAGVTLVDVSPPLKGELELLFLSENTQRRLKKSGGIIRLKHGLRGYAKPELSGYGITPQATTIEIDFDNDNIVDLLVSYESCPEEAGDSSDIVNATNINGKWVRQLMSQSWCYP